MKTIKLNDEALEVFENLKKAFREKFGRDPGPNDPIFFDPEADEPRYFTDAKIKEMQRQICEAMRIANIDPAIIYAYQKTDRLVTSDNMQFLSRAELKEWLYSTICG
jgi:hypothetical protein